jgi:5-methyltetrahydrofolate--homocysteine methyltransferase
MYYKAEGMSVMDIREFMKDNFVYLDGGMGTLLQAAGLKPGELPERWNVSRPETIVAIQKAYFDAGSNVVLANTFGANGLKYDDAELEQIVTAALANARKAREESDREESEREEREKEERAREERARTGGAFKTREKYVALDIGPLGKLLKPYGDYEFEDAVAMYAKTVRLGAAAGADLIFIETMNDSYDTKAALLAAKENSDLPVFVSNAYGSDGKLMTGASPAAMVAMLEGMRADAIGVNCSLGPDQLAGVVEEYLAYASVPVLLKPNAGLPRTEEGRTVYDVLPEAFSTSVARLMEKGVRIVGGCCGTTPDYLKALREKGDLLTPVPVTVKERTLVSSYTHAVEFGKAPVLIGERINPTGKKRLKQALRERDMDYILGEGLRQQDAGAHVLDVNVGLPGIDEPAVLEEVVKELQSVCDLPLQLDTTDVAAMEAGLRAYNGKAMVNSVNGKAEVMDAVFPLVAKYGGLVVALTLDEEGIPADPAKRAAIANKIVECAKGYGIEKKDLIFDPLAMAVSADTRSGPAALEAVRRIRRDLNANTSLGVSNVSFGLPERDIINSAFFAMCLEEGLSAAIMNPFSRGMMDVYYAYKALHDMDENCMEYIEYTRTLPQNTVGGAGNEAAVGTTGAIVGASGTTASASSGSSSGSPSGISGRIRIIKEGEGCACGCDQDLLQNAIIRGLKDKTGRLTRELLAYCPPLDIIQTQIIPSLNIVGEQYERKKVYLPQLLMAADAAKVAFEEIKAAMSKGAVPGSGSEAAEAVHDAGGPYAAVQNKVAENGAAVGADVPVRCTVIIATVRGDIHDIGKNIVKLILENYGFKVVDLGKDVPERVIVDETVRLHAPLVGLSALMTTTVPSMEATIKLLREEAPWAKVCVGGAVLTQEYADSIGADKYVRDAMDTVRYAEEIDASLS